MSKYTYLIEYFQREVSDDVFHTLWSDDEKLEDSLLITQQDVHSIFLSDWKNRLGGYLTMFPNCKEQFRDLWYREDNWKIKIRIQDRYKNTFTNKECAGISDSLYGYLACLSKGMYLLEYEALTNEDVDDIKEKLIQYDVPSITNYIYVKCLSPFFFNINKVRMLNEILTTVKDVEHILEKHILNYDNSEEFVVKGAHHDLRSVITSEIPKISGLFASMTAPLGFQYEYTPYISFSQFFRRLKRLIEVEMEYRIATTDNKEEAAEVDYSKHFSKDEIIEELVPYKCRERFVKALDEINHRYKLSINPKLDIACVMLLIREHCPLLDQNKVKTFKKFMALMCAYFGLPKVSYKENDCIERKKAMFRKDRYFWETTIAQRYGYPY